MIEVAVGFHFGMMCFVMGHFVVDLEYCILWEFWKISPMSRELSQLNCVPCELQCEMLTPNDLVRPCSV